MAARCTPGAHPLCDARATEVSMRRLTRRALARARWSRRALAVRRCGRGTEVCAKASEVIAEVVMAKRGTSSCNCWERQETSSSLGFLHLKSPKQVQILSY